MRALRGCNTWATSAILVLAALTSSLVRAARSAGGVRQLPYRRRATQSSSTKPMLGFGIVEMNSVHKEGGADNDKCEGAS